MTDLLGADLQTGGQATDFEPTPTTYQPASPGYERDARGNEYKVAGSQPAAQSTDTGGSVPAGQAQSVAVPGASLNQMAGVGPEGSAQQAPARDPQLVMAVQEAMRRASAAEQRLAQAEFAREQRDFETRIANLPPEHQAIYRARRDLQLREAQMTQAAERQALAQQQADQTVHKETVVILLSDRYGVPRDRLRTFNSPEAMEEFAKTVSEMRREQQAQTRQASKVDAAVTAGHGSPPPTSWKQQPLREALSTIFD